MGFGIGTLKKVGNRAARAAKKAKDTGGKATEAAKSAGRKAASAAGDTVEFSKDALA